MGPTLKQSTIIKKAIQVYEFLYELKYTNICHHNQQIISPQNPITLQNLHVLGIPISS